MYVAGGWWNNLATQYEKIGDGIGMIKLICFSNSCYTNKTIAFSFLHAKSLSAKSNT